MSEPTKDELMARLAAAQQEHESCIAALIWLELDEIRSGLDGTEAEAAARLRDAHDALAAPLAQLAAIDAEIADAERKRALRQEQLSSPDLTPDDRGPIRWAISEWDADIASLRAKREQAEALAQPYFAEHDKCRKDVQVVQAAKQRLMAAMLNPFGDPLAMATEMYVGLRQPYLNHVILKGDRSDPEWEMAAAELAELQRVIENPRYVPEVMARADTTPPDVAPNAAEVIAQDEVMVRNLALARQPTVRERRDVPRTSAQPPQSYMEVPRLRDMLGG